jgi:hypothetical protein
MHQEEAPARMDIFEGQATRESNDTELDYLNVEGLYDIGMLSLFPFNLESDSVLFPP